jgi:hypothetical protein
LSTASPSPRALPRGAVGDTAVHAARGLDEHAAEAWIEAQIALPEETGD